MSPDARGVPVPTNGHRPRLAEPSPTPSDADDPTPMPSSPPDVTPGLLLSPTDLVIGFGVIAGILLIIDRLRRRA